MELFLAEIKYKYIEGSFYRLVLAEHEKDAIKKVKKLYTDENILVFISTVIK